MSRSRVIVPDYAFAPERLDFGNVPPGAPREVELTLTNGPNGVGANVFGSFDVIASWNRFELDSEHIDLTGLGLRYRW